MLGIQPEERRGHQKGDYESSSTLTSQLSVFSEMHQTVANIRRVDWNDKLGWNAHLLEKEKNSYSEGLKCGDGNVGGYNNMNIPIG